MNTKGIIPIGTKVRVTFDERDAFDQRGAVVGKVDGPWLGLTGTVRNYTQLGTENIHIVDFDEPTEKSGAYGSIRPEHLEAA